MKHIGNLKYAEGSRHKKKRIGRGEGSGYGGTATRGHKGQKSRSGYRRNYGFEGGQMPINRRLPKFGFNNIFKKEYQVINVGRLQELVEDNKLEGEVNVDKLYELGAIKGKKKPLKILGEGELKSSLSVEANKFSESAKKKIETAGGTVKANE